MEETTQYYTLEQPDQIATRDKEDAMGAYLMMFGALAAGLPLPILNLIAAIIYYYVNAKKSRFIKFHSLQSLLSQAPTTLMNAGLLFWTISILTNAGDGIVIHQGQVEEFNPTMTDYYWGYLITVVVANLLYFIFSLIGAAKARKGHMYYFVFFGKLAYHYAYRVRETDHQTDQNLPPI